MKTTISVFDGQKRLAYVEGREVSDDNVPISVIEKILETERFLESLTGRRFHIHVNTGD